MKYCSQCLQPDTRPNTVFLPTGICPACNYFNHLNDVDYPNRYEILKKIFLNYPKKSGQYFDCIIGVSGGKDSTRQALWIREKLGKLLSRIAAEHARKIICVSNQLQRNLPVGIEKSTVIPSGVDTRRFKLTRHFSRVFLYLLFKRFFTPFFK